jgi:hypothetical protein
LALQNDGVLNLDLKNIKIGGQVTLESADLPYEPLGRGDIVFVQAQTGHLLYVSLETSGAFSYEVTLSPGVYHVDFYGNPALCVEPDSEIPCNVGRLISDLNLQNDGVLNIDIPAITIQGQVTLEQSPLPAENLDRGTLLFSHHGFGQVATEAFENSGSFAYELTLLPGSYDILLDANEGLCLQTNDVPQMPCIDGPLLTNLNLQNDGVLNIDIPVIKIQGQVTLEDNQLPAENMDRGALLFELQNGGTVLSKQFKNSGNFSYELTLLPGQYDILLDANEALCLQNNVVAKVPCIDGTLLSNLSLQNDGVLNVDIPAITIQGQVTLEGSQLPNENLDRGSLMFVLQDGGIAVAKQFEDSGSFAYEMTLLPGDYDIILEANEALCMQNNVIPKVPCINGPLLSDLNLQNDGVLNVDIPAITIQGQVTLNGSQLPAENLDRGSLLFVLHDGGELPTKPFEDNGSFAYELTLLPGSYKIRLDANEGLCLQTNDVPQMPCIDGTLLYDLNLQNDGVLNVDIPAINIQGQVTLEGVELPGEVADRGQLDFYLHDGGRLLTKVFENNGMFAYEVALLPGNYKIYHRSNPELCNPDNPQPDVPCIDQMIIGCEN